MKINKPPIIGVLLAKLGFFKIKSARQATTIVIEIDNTGHTNVNQIQHITPKDLKIVLQNIIRSIK